MANYARAIRLPIPELTTREARRPQGCSPSLFRRPRPSTGVKHRRPARPRPAPGHARTGWIARPALRQATAQSDTTPRREPHEILKLLPGTCVAQVLPPSTGDTHECPKDVAMHHGFVR